MAVEGRVLVTGAGGLLGGWLLRMAPADVDLAATVHRAAVDGVLSASVDLLNPGSTSFAFRVLQPRTVVHAAYAMDEASIVTATDHVVAASAEVRAAAVLISTDAVFSGDGVARSEGATPDPIWDYGRWKAAAEQAVLAAGGAVVRLPLLVSVEPDDHVVAPLRAKLAAGERTTWFDDEIRRPALASEVAAALWRLVGVSAADRAGVWHLMGPERLSRFQIAQRVAARLGAPADLVTGEPTRPDLVRPRDLELSDERARAELGWDPSPVLA